MPPSVEWVPYKVGCDPYWLSQVERNFSLPWVECEAEQMDWDVRGQEINVSLDTGVACGRVVRGQSGSLEFGCRVRSEVVVEQVLSMVRWLGSK